VTGWHCRWQKSANAGAMKREEERVYGIVERPIKIGKLLSKFEP
jgi:hypothetical protein